VKSKLSNNWSVMTLKWYLQNNMNAFPNDVGSKMFNHIRYLVSYDTRSVIYNKLIFLIRTNRIFDLD
jgi:hypothetical protein